MLLDREHPRALAATRQPVHDFAPLLSAPAAGLGLGSLRHLRRVRGLRSRRQGPAETLRTGQLLGVSIGGSLAGVADRRVEARGRLGRRALILHAIA